MGEKKLKLSNAQPQKRGSRKRAVAIVPKDWRTAGRLLNVQEVVAITQFGYWNILGLIREGRLLPVLGRKPYMFDPDQIHNVFFTQSVSTPPAPKPRSLKIEIKGGSVSQNTPARKGDLWRD